MDSSVGNTLFTGGSELLSKKQRVLVFDVFKNRIPAVLVIDLVAKSGGVDDGKPQLDAVFFNNWWPMVRITVRNKT